MQLCEELRKMTRSSFPFYLLLIVLVCASVKNMVPKAKALCTKATIGGGCPNINECVETCRPCYRGVGEVEVSCVAPGGGIPYHRCVCAFSHGAPCDPPAPPRCPAPWPRAVVGLNNGTVLA